jgi:arylsulfatase A-like enzyme/HEAT repeat protein
LLDGLGAASLARLGLPEPGLPLTGLGCAALGAAALVLLFLALRGVAARLLGAARSARAGRLAAVVLALPVVGYDALAMFGGTRAARIPGRPFLSLGAFLLGLLAVWWLAAALERRIEGIERGQRPAWQGWLGALLLAAVALAVYLANRLVLPHLYSWFHATLSLCLLVAAVLSARFALARPGLRRSPRILVAGLAGVVAAGAAGLVLVGRSHQQLFVAHERTQLIGFAVRLSPVRPPRRMAAPPVVGGSPASAPLPPGPVRREADVVLITVDALRADHVGAYGYSRPTTPNIDALARRGVRFERAYAQAPHTSFSVTSMLTGRYYPTQARLEPGRSTDALPFQLRRYGWKTAAFYPEAVFYVEADKLREFEASHFEFEYVKVEYLDAHARLAQIAEFFEQERPRRVFLWIHFFEPHEPYERWTGHDFGPRDIDRYDSEIAYTDAAIGRVVSYFDKNRPGTIFILTADHGEAFDEHKARYHGTSLYDEQVRVPLIIAVPGSPAQVVAGPVELVDISPTILGLLDIPLPIRMRGTDLGPWLASPPAPAERLGHAFAELEETRMVASVGDKLICQIKESFCAYHDLRTDPGELRNLADDNPARVAALRGELEAWIADQTRFSRLSQGTAGEPPVLERARLGDPAAVDEVAALLSADNPAPLREEAARLLATTLPARPQTAAALRACLPAGSPGLRDWATVALARLGDATAAEKLVPLATAGAATPLRMQAALILAGAGQPAAVPTLVEELGRCKEVSVCRPIVQAMGKLRDRRATSALIGHLAAVMGRRDTVAALGELGDPAAIPALAERLVQDEYVTVRAAAAEALGSLAKSTPAAAGEIRPVLQSALRKEKEPVAQAAVREALERITAGSPSKPRSSANRAHSRRPAQRR